MRKDIMMNGGFYAVGAKYTIHVADLLKNGFFENHEGYVHPLADYPIFNEAYRDPLNTMIIDHFMMWEIGQETEVQFYFALKSKMWEIMPKLNVLLKARDGLEYDPLKDHDFTITHAQAGTLDTQDDLTEGKTSQEVMDDDTTSHVTTDGTYNTITRDSDTPQQNINNLGYGVDDTWINQWLTHGQIINNDHEDETTGQGTDDRTTDYTHSVQDNRTIDTDTTLNYTQRHEGRREAGQTLALKLSALAFDIETQIIQALTPLFMGLYEL
ncbi:MAG: hypothetical protein IKA00_11195 [Prevotella sp.]|nr:hypothetical protein [Prevotella sp.]